MKKPILLYFLTLSIAIAGLVFATGSKRAAIVVDSANQTTVINNFELGADFSHFGFGINYTNNRFYDKPCIGLKTKVFNVAILIDQLVSIEAEKGHATVIYQLNDQEKKITGELLEADVIGQCDLGDFSLSTGKIKKLTFKEPAISNADKQSISLNDTLILVNGSRLPVAKLRRSSTTSSTKFVGVSDYSQFDDIRFMKGESQFIVDFVKIKNISFQTGSNVIVTLKTGASNNGKLPAPDGNGAEVVGFTGTCMEGEFFISAKQVQEIEFGN